MSGKLLQGPETPSYPRGLTIMNDFSPSDWSNYSLLQIIPPINSYLFNNRWSWFFTVKVKFMAGAPKNSVTKTKYLYLSKTTACSGALREAVLSWNHYITILAVLCRFVSALLWFPMALGLHPCTYKWWCTAITQSYECDMYSFNPNPNTPEPANQCL